MPVYQPNGAAGGAGVFVYRGAIDCSGNPNYPGALQGDVYVVSVAGKIGGASGLNVVAGDMLFCKTTTLTGTQAAVGANWDVIEYNVDWSSVTITGGTINGATIGATTPSTGVFTTVLAGSNANFTDFPYAQAVISQGATNRTSTNNIGLALEGLASIANTRHGYGNYSVGQAAGAYNGVGVFGVGTVTATTDTGIAYGVYGSSIATHASGSNVGVFGTSQNGAFNFAFDGEYGNCWFNRIDGNTAVGRFSGDFYYHTAFRPNKKFSVFGGDVEFADDDVLGSESLSETDFATHANWSTTGDYDDTGGNATYTHSAGNGTLTQASGSFATAIVPGRWYKFQYTISGFSGTSISPTATITTAIAETATALVLADGTQAVYFRAAAVPGNFIISSTSTVGGFVLDDVSLKEVQGGDLFVNGYFLGVGGSEGIKITQGGQVLVGVSASVADFPYAKLISAQANTGKTLTAYNIGLIGEASAGSARTGLGCAGAATTSAALDGIGVGGSGAVSASGDTGTAYGGKFSAEDTHAGGANIGCYATATAGATNYAYYGVAGNNWFNQTSGVTLVGAAALASSFSGTQLIVTQTATGAIAAVPAGGIFEAKAGAASLGVGVAGFCLTNGANNGIGVYGNGIPSNTADSGEAVGVNGSSSTTHAGGRNVGVKGEAANGATNYAFLGTNGNCWFGEITGVTYIGATALAADVTTTRLFVSYSDTGETVPNYNVYGAVLEAAADGSHDAIGGFALAKTSATNHAYGWGGIAYVANSSDTTVATGGWGQATDTHTSGPNVGLQGDATGGKFNLGFYNIYGNNLFNTTQATYGKTQFGYFSTYPMEASFERQVVINNRLGVCGSLEVVDDDTLDSESLDETTFATHAKWDVTGDMDDTGGYAEYTHNTGVGTLTQTSGNMVTAGVGMWYYVFAYTVSDSTGSCAATITSSFAGVGSSVELPLTDGTHAVYFRAGSSPGDFVISVTSTSGGFKITQVSLVRLLGGSMVVYGETAFGGNVECAASIAASENVQVGKRLLLAKGGDVASVADITLGDGNYFDITGTADINTIAGTDWTASSIIVLQFDGDAATNGLRHNQAGAGARVLLAGSADFAYTANDTISLVFDGTYWREIARTAI